jgi:hypothetical protein
MSRYTKFAANGGEGLTPRGAMRMVGAATLGPCAPAPGAEADAQVMDASAASIEAHDASAGSP